VAKSAETSVLPLARRGPVAWMARTSPAMTVERRLKAKRSEHGSLRRSAIATVGETASPPRPACGKATL